VNVFTSVGKKFISLLVCSILNVYNGALTSLLGLAATAVTAQNAMAALITTISTTFRLSVISPPLNFH
jgi:hypothetical protein